MEGHLFFICNQCSSHLRLTLLQQSQATNGISRLQKRWWECLLHLTPAVLFRLQTASWDLWKRETTQGAQAVSLLSWIRSFSVSVEEETLQANVLWSNQEHWCCLYAYLVGKKKTVTWEWLAFGKWSRMRNWSFWHQCFNNKCCQCAMLTQRYWQLRNQHASQLNL